MPAVVNSSLTYEILMYLNSFYFGMFAICEMGMGLFKATNLPLPDSGTTATEFILLVLLLVVEGIRVFVGRKGNLSERKYLSILGMVLAIPSAIATLYFLIWQNYVLRLEVILCSLQLVLIVCELIISIMCLLTQHRPSGFQR